jgi:hypothetical protein
MSKLGGLSLLAFVSLAAAACTTTTGGGQGGGYAGSGMQAAVAPPGMTAAQGAAYCSKLSQTAEYVGTVGGYLGGATSGGQAADLDARVAIAQCQDGNYASGIPVLQQKLRDARVTVPPPPTAG